MGLLTIPMRKKEREKTWSDSSRSSDVLYGGGAGSKKQGGYTGGDFGQKGVGYKKRRNRCTGRENLFTWAMPPVSHEEKS